MAELATGVCEPWATEADLCSPCDDYALDAPLLADAIDAASNILYRLSGGRFPGVCADEVRPYGQCGCGCRGRCSGLHEVNLGAFPVVAVSEVKIDGDILPSNHYRIDDNRYLVRLPVDDRNPGWPCCQRLDLADTELDTFSVSFTWGIAPPIEGVQAAAKLACELVKSCQPELLGKCQLPKRVQSISRQGISMTLLDPFDFLEKGKTGIYEIDLFLAAYPGGARTAPGVFSPDMPRGVRRVGT